MTIKTVHEKPAFIVGGGPSLTGFDFRKLTYFNTIAINKAIFHVPAANMFITHDLAFFKKLSAEEKEKLQSSPAAKFFVLCPVTYGYTEIVNARIYDRRPYPESPNGYEHDLRLVNAIIHSRREDGLGIDWEDFRHGENSGYSALQLAIVMKFNPIYLLGFDMTVQPYTAHWHEGYGEDPQAVQERLDKYINTFKSGITDLKENAPWIDVISCSPASPMNEFMPYRSIEEALRI
jgi:hypothetical protein